MINFSLVILAKTDNENVFNMNLNCINSFVQSVHRANVSYEIIIVDKFTFLYYTICTNCLIMYLDNYPINFKKIFIRRELFSGINW